MDDEEEICEVCGIDIVNGGEGVDGALMCLDCYYQWVNQEDDDV